MPTSEDNAPVSNGPLVASNQALVARKLEAEIAKLEAETRSLRKPLSQPSTWIPMAVGLAGILTAVGQWQRAELEAQRSLLTIEREKAQAEVKIQRATEELSRYQRDFLERVVHNLDLTRDAAIRYYAPRGEWWHVLQLRTSNLEIESLLNTMSKAQILPAVLVPDLDSLRTHYALWLHAFDLAFPDGHPGPHSTKVAVGTFPIASEARIRACLQALLQDSTCGPS